MNFSFFENYSDSQMENIVKHISMQVWPKDEFVFRQGESGDEFFFIFEGEVEVLVASQEEPVAVLGPGNTFGELALLHDAPRQASVRCRTPTRLGILQRAAFQRAVRSQKLMEDSR